MNNFDVKKKKLLIKQFKGTGFQQVTMNISANPSMSILERGPNITLMPKSIPTIEITSNVGQAITNLASGEAEENTQTIYQLASKSIH